MSVGICFTSREELRQFNQETSMEEALARVERIDWTPIIGKLCDGELGEGWDYQRAETALLWYKRLLALRIVYQDGFNPLTEDIDEVWHTAVLHTRKYAEDCQILFGEFLHHQPCLSDIPPEAKQVLADTATRTIKRFQQYFGESPQGVVDCGSNYPCWCGGK